MAITFERADTIDDSIFDSLYSTSVDDIKSGTMLIPEDKTSDEDIKAWVKGIFNQESNSRHGRLVKHEGNSDSPTVCSGRMIYSFSPCFTV